MALSNLLAVVEKTTDLPEVLAQADLLSCCNGEQATLHVVRVVYEAIADLPMERMQPLLPLRQAILAAEENALEDCVAEFSVAGAEITSATVWNRRPWEGILQTAASVQADLIIKKAKSTLLCTAACIRSPDDWNLLRHSKVPVLLTTQHNRLQRKPVLAAIDALDASNPELQQRILHTSVDIAKRTRSSLHLVSTYPQLKPWQTYLSERTCDHKLQTEIEQEIRERMEALARSALLEDYRCHIAQGSPASAINAVLQRIDGGVLVMGCQLNSDGESALLGSTAEAVLQDTPTNVLTVPN